MFDSRLTNLSNVIFIYIYSFTKYQHIPCDLAQSVNWWCMAIDSSMVAHISLWPHNIHLSFVLCHIFHCLNKYLWNMAIVFNILKCFPDKNFVVAIIFSGLRDRSLENRNWTFDYSFKIHCQKVKGFSEENRFAEHRWQFYTLSKTHNVALSEWPWDGPFKIYLLIYLYASLIIHCYSSTRFSHLDSSHVGTMPLVEKSTPGLILYKPTVCVCFPGFG